LNNGAAMPQLGFGVWQVPDDEVTSAVATALEVGYRSIDTAAAYRNEKGVGRAIADSEVSRDELFVTTKLWNRHQGHDSTLRAFDASLENLGLDHVDLYLIHWPLPAKDAYVETWKALERLYAEGRARAIGVSNFQPIHLRRLFDEADIVPAVNQIELHPGLQQHTLRDLHAEHGIVTEAWSPLAQGGALLKEDTVTSIADRLGRSPAQVVLRWHLQTGHVVIPKSVTPSRIRENFDVFGFELTADDVSAIDTLETGTRTGPDPDTFNLGA
jgi:2,5-diketo-D-gluconate reductase A